METRRVTAAEAKELMEKEGYTLLDVRSTPEFVAEHAQGAFNIPFLHKQPYGMVANPDFSKVVEAVFPDKKAKLITTCGMGARSVRAAAELVSRGYTDVIDMRGGFEGEKDDQGTVTVAGWKSAGLPTETGETPHHAYVELYAKLSAPKSVPPAAAAAAPPKATGVVNRFADPGRLVDCVKLGQKLPGLKRRPLGGPLGERIYTTISAEAWGLWAEHSKLIINENRLNPSDPAAQDLLVKQCEIFLFGGGEAEKPKEFRPQ